MSVKDLPYNTPYTDHFQRAGGNLQYLEFIDLVKGMWESVGGAPIVPSSGEQFAQYPSIVYSLGLRKTHPSEPKPKYRDEIITHPDEDGLIICGQRYQNIVNFTVVHDECPRLAEEIVEAFEDFMLEYTPIFKQMGLSEIVYARRLPDDDQPRVAEGVNMRTVSYLVTTEKIIRTSYWKWNTMLIHANASLIQHPFFGVHHTLTAHIDWSEQASPSFSEPGTIFVVWGGSYRLGDVVVLTTTGPDDLLPRPLEPRTPYYIVKIVDIPLGPTMPDLPPSLMGLPMQGYLLATENITERPFPIYVEETVSTAYKMGYITPAPAVFAESPAVTHIVDDDFQTPAP